MADIRDEHGRPIQLTDELGRPVQLTDEHGVPINLTGVATVPGRTTIGSELRDKTAHDQPTHGIMGSETHGATHFAPTPMDYAKHGAGGAIAGAGAATTGVAAGAAKGAVTGGGAPVSHTQAHGVGVDKNKLERSNSSSSSSSEDDGQGGRRKKKGVMQKIKEKLPGHHQKEENQATAHSADTKVRNTGVGPAGTRVEYPEQEHEKKGFMDKIKDKLPGHHGSR